MRDTIRNCKTDWNAEGARQRHWLRFRRKDWLALCIGALGGLVIAGAAYIEHLEQVK